MLEKNLSTLKIGTMLNVQAYKYDGVLYRQWNSAKVLNNNSKHLVLFLLKARVSDIDKKRWAYRDPVLWFFPKNNLFNAVVLLRKNGPYIYINVASQPVIEDDVLKYIDFDLDIKYYPNKELKLVDREEYYKNKKQLKYPKKLQKMIYEELTELINLYNNYSYIFDNKVIDYYKHQAVADKSIRYDAIFQEEECNHKSNRPTFKVNKENKNIEFQKNKLRNEA
ncbi:hypothetical protein MCRO_0084 [Mycoplasma crocodyli MP145]|uniref:DUF402 domain-containing protein n=2 Tax=Mycoplasma TaxID=2093 RepID=D5E4R9_MYCCM|nr:hypothetical protein MCRO_0084 [Mycoplasma crocodyli MP145]